MVLFSCQDIALSLLVKSEKVASTYVGRKTITRSQADKNTLCW